MNIDKEYCLNRPVLENKYGDLRDKYGKLGRYPDQYNSFQNFVDDIWMRFKPFSGKNYFLQLSIVQDGIKLVNKNKTSKFYGQTAENRYITRSRYSHLKQHYKVIYGNNS